MNIKNIKRINKKTRMYGCASSKLLDLRKENLYFIFAYKIILKRQKDASRHLFVYKQLFYILLCEIWF
ncbi:hypothetical protein COO17_09845 [Bacillus wiedmannii]|uniref:Uncharacterized protein n=1 Tax=Bacillus wiedmannii TaxID=1890302 RepID=A0A2A7BTS5_9BACI|nr:hypothetical protein TU62_22610 [Bacillus cereus]PDY41824.1 hypothetical protein COO17_09845 [Bacillus wiedmannii]